MGSEAKKFATYEDLLDLPENVIGEIIAGELITSPRPGGPHALASSVLGIEIGGPFQRGKNGGPGGWWIIDKPEIHLRGDIVVPDLAGWKKELHPKPPLAGAYTEAPTQWICEVLSPSTAGVDRVRKLPIYAKELIMFG